VTPEAQRVEVLSALSCVDLVVLFDEDTPLELVRSLLPDVIVKGEDWREKGVVGADVVEAHGGKVVLVPLTPGLSSSEVIRRIREDEAPGVDRAGGEGA
jgi:D-beta-D-heptose 7-phosphate kinase/D-beta-D-heptose 1-phosphate adenosyltransferase